jgi:mercuric ion transport protein
MSKSSPAHLRHADSNPPVKAEKNFIWAAAGGIIGALGIAACCLLPLVLLTLGLGGAWVGSMVALTPYKPLFIVLTAALLGYGYYLVYFAPKKACLEGEVCQTPRATRWMKVTLWGAIALAIAGLGIDYVEPYLVG